MDFYGWLVSTGRSEKTAKNYSGPMSGRLSSHVLIIQDPSFDHEQLKTVSSFKIYCQHNDPSGELLELNERGKDMYRRALVTYSEYVQSELQVDVFEFFSRRVASAQQDSSENRRNRLANAPKKPSKSTAIIEVFDRNPDVVAEVLLRANGFCECCGKRAPFVRKSDNTPYLEVHHKVPLAKGGEDAVENAEGLCPNCHREKHYGL